MRILPPAGARSRQLQRAGLCAARARKSSAEYPADCPPAPRARVLGVGENVLEARRARPWQHAAEGNAKVGLDHRVTSRWSGCSAAKPLALLLQGRQPVVSTVGNDQVGVRSSAARSCQQAQAMCPTWSISDAAVLHMPVIVDPGDEKRGARRCDVRTTPTVTGPAVPAPSSMPASSR